MTLITPKRATELLALLPEDANFAAIGDSELYLCWPDQDATWPHDVEIRTVAELEPDDATLPVLAAAADALRTVQHLYDLLEQIQASVTPFPHMLSDEGLQNQMKAIHSLLEQHGITGQERDA